MSAEIRIFNRTIGETIKGIIRAGWMNLIIISTMAAILTIFGCLFRSSLFVAHFVDELGDSMQVSIYLKDGYEPEKLKEKILDYKNIKSIKIITKEEAWKSIKEEMDLPDLGNSLPDKIEVSLKDKAYTDEFIKITRKLDGVEDIFYAKELANRISMAGYYTNIIAGIIIVLLGGLTFFIINNTIHLVIESRKQEIEIMKMMGASDWYIKAPYVFQGAFYGFAGGLLSAVPIYFLSIYFKKIAEFFYINYHFLSTNIVVLITLLTGIIVGVIGSTISVRKYLKI